MSFGEITTFMSHAVDPVAETKPVYYRPSTSTDTIRVGDLVCYNWDLTTDYKERSTQPISGGSTYAEGSQNYTGRLFVVEKPATANLQFFAGVVAKLGPLAGADGDLIEIYVPNGAIVPVMCDQYNTNGRTIVAVRDGAYEGSFPSNDARPIGVAAETIDRSTTDGLCWVKVDPGMFIWQRSNDDALLVDDETDAWTQVNQLQIEYAGSQWMEALSVQMDLLAGCTGDGISLNVDLNMYATACDGSSNAIQGSVYFQSGFVATTGGATALGGKVDDSADVDLTGMVVSCLHLEHYIGAGSTGPTFSTMIRLNATAGANAPDYFIYSQNPSALAYAESAGVTSTKCGDIAIYCAGCTTPAFYIRTYNAAG